MNNFYVYVHYRNDTLKPFYVGKGKGKRYKTKHNRNSYWKNIVNKVGFTPMIVENFITEEKSFELEKYYIQHFGRNNLCNMTDGGEGSSGCIPNEKTRKKFSENTIGKKNPMYGKKSAMYGKKHTDETKKKMSDKQKGEKHPMYGKKHTDETKKKMSNKHKGEKNSFAKKVINTLTGEIYCSGKEVANIFNINYSTLNKQLLGKNPNKTPFKYL